MCRSIKVLRDGATAAPPDEIEAAARQFVRKVSGFSRPAAHNQAVFDQAVADVAAATERLLGALEIRGSAPAGPATRRPAGSSSA
jgi:hypothetical protein